MKNVFDQSLWQCRMEWGLRGVREAAGRKDIIVLVDVLSFSSTIVTAIHFGATIYPFPMVDGINEFARSVGAEALYGRVEALKIKKPSLSPISFNSGHQNKKFVLSSLNGATCAKLCKKVPALVTGCLLNATAVAHAVNNLQKMTNSNITVIACGEQWDIGLEHENSLRPCVEDYLGAGAVLSELEGSKSPEATVCITAFENSKSVIEDLVWNCGSGIELREKGFPEDVSFSSRINVFQGVPILNQEDFQNVYFDNLIKSLTV